MEPMNNLFVQLPADLYQKLKTRADILSFDKSRKVSMAKIVREALEKYLQSNNI
jgi:hypothetical protein